MAGSKEKISMYKYPLAEQVIMQDYGWDTAINTNNKARSRPGNTADADLEAAFKYWRRKLARLVDSLLFNVLMIVVVLISVGCVIYNELFADVIEKDCFGRYTPAEAIIFVLVFIFFVIELCLRILSQGMQSYFAFRKKALWNWFDTAVVVVACVFSAVKLFEDLQFQISCPSSGKCPRKNANFYNGSSFASIFSESCPTTGKCLFTPSSPYSTTLDSQWEASDHLCNGESSGTEDQIAANTATGARLISRAIILAKIVMAIISTLKNEQSRFLYLHEIRLNVSRIYGAWHGIRRYRILDYDLDLSYITNRLIAFAAPTSISCYMVDDEKRIIGLNSAEMTSRFLGEHHYGRLKVYNLCAESIGNYSAHLFSTVSRIPIEHTSDTPLLVDILVFCDNMARFLRTDTSTVVAIHCSDGCRRTGVLCACWLLYCGHRNTARSALQLFANRRYKLDKGPNNNIAPALAQIPSQIRVVEYLEQILKQGLPSAPQEAKAFTRTLNPEIEIEGLTVIKNSGALSFSFQIICQGIIVHDSENGLTAGSATSSTDVAFPPVLVRGEVRVTFFDRRKGFDATKTALFFLSFHTGFINGPSHNLKDNRLVFDKCQLDGAHLDTGHKLFDKDLKVEVKVKAPGALRSNSKSHQRFKEQLRELARGQERLFFKGQHIIEAGQRTRHLFFILNGIVLQEVDDKETDIGAGKTNIGMLFPGDFFGAEGFYVRARQLRHVAASESVEVVVISRTTSKDRLTVSALGLHGVASLQRTCSFWTTLNRSASPKSEGTFSRLPEFDRTMAEMLCREYHINRLKSRQRMGLQLVENASVSLQESIRLEVIKRCRIPDSEFFLSAHACDIRVNGKLQVNGRVILMTHYIVFDNKTNANSTSVFSKGAVFHAVSLTDVYRASMQVKVVVALLNNVEHEFTSASPPDAASLYAAFKALLSDPHISFERSLVSRQSLSAKRYGYINPDIANDLNLPPTPCANVQSINLTAVQPSVCSLGSLGSAAIPADIFRDIRIFQRDETVMAEGCLITCIYRVVDGSVVLQTGGQVKEVFRAGSLFGDAEHLLGRPRSLGRYSAGPESGCTLVSLQLSAVEGPNENSQTAGRLYAELARKYADRQHSLLLHVRPYAFESKQKQGATAQPESGDPDDDGGGLAQHRVDRIRLRKMLRLRRCGLLRPLGGAALDQISSQSRLISVPEGGTLMRQGEELVPGVSDCMYVLLSGVMRVLVQVPNSSGNGNNRAQDDEQPVLNCVDTIVCGDVVGEAAVLGASRVRTATVVAESPCKVAQLSRAVVEGVIISNPDVEGLFREVMKQRMSKRLYERMRVVTDFLESTLSCAGAQVSSRTELCTDQASKGMGSTIHLRAGDVLIRQGDEIVSGVSDFMYMIISGTMRVYVQGPLIAPGRIEGEIEKIEVEVLTSGALIGEAGLMTGRPRSATVVAETECELMAVAQGVVRTVLLPNDEVRESMMQVADERMRSNLAARMRAVGRTIEQEAPPDGKRTVRLRRGDTLMRQGDNQVEEQADGLYVLLSGTMEVLMLRGGSSSQGNQMPELVDVIHAGAVIGEAELISGIPRMATVAAMTDCELVEVSKSVLTILFATNSGLRRSLEAITEQRDVLRSFSATFTSGSEALAAAAATAAAVAEAKSDQNTGQPLSARRAIKWFTDNPAVLKTNHRGEDSAGQLVPGSATSGASSEADSPRRLAALSASVVFESTNRRTPTLQTVPEYLS